MRAREFIVENLGSTVPTTDSKLSVSNADALPSVYSIPELPNNDFYKQYRFGVAIAGARGRKSTTDQQETNMGPASAWGENQIVVGYDLDPEIIDQALETIGLKASDKRLISTTKSEEAGDIEHVSPLNSFRGYER